MSIFAVVALDQSPSDPLDAAIERTFPGRFFKVAQGHWLVNAAGTAQQISTELGITDGSVGVAIVYNVGGYFGYAPNPTWEWLKSAMSAGVSAGG
jgi:hypothetical protein